MDYGHISSQRIKEFIISAFTEDVGTADHSTLAAVPRDKTGKAALMIKENGIIAGLELAELIFLHFDQELEIDVCLKDGQQVKKGDIGLTVSGKATSILTTERLVLNCLQRMSGIATKTHRMNQLIKHTNARLLDTRKTTPNFRMLEKWAVVIGGGMNHRYGLFDMIMLKDNHIDFAGGIPQAIHATQKYLKENNLNLKIEVETRNLSEVKEVLSTGGIDIIMLDNMDNKTLRTAVDLIGGKYLTEASGGIDEGTIGKIAECGVDYISVGALTHQVKSMDISLKALTPHQRIGA